MNETNKQPSDDELMAQFVETLDEESFNEIVSRYYPLMTAIASGRLANKDAAHFIVQKAFTNMIRTRTSFNPDTQFSRWFLNNLKNMCIAYQQRHSKEHRIIQRFSQTIDEGAIPSGHDSALNLLEALTPHDREILMLRTVQGLSFSTIADFCDCSIEAAKKRAQRALKRLREHLSRKVSMSCDKISENLDLLALNGLTEKKQQAMDLHLESCSNCRDDLRIITETSEEFLSAAKVTSARTHEIFRREMSYELKKARRRKNISPMHILKSGGTLLNYLRFQRK